VTTGTTACNQPCREDDCGLGDLGRRDCACLSGIFQCATCQFPNNEPVVQRPPTPLPGCLASVVENASCPNQFERCMRGAEVCACLQEPTDWRWDCNEVPWDRPTCPANPPSIGAGCGSVGYSCVYGARHCQCDAAGVWFCQSS
jgi:hypothetical protein